MPEIPATISFVVLYVNDLAVSRSFYEQKLGFPVKQTDEGYVEFETKGAPLALLSLKAAEDLTGEKLVGRSHATFFALSLGEVPDVDAVYEHLRSQGVKFVREPATQPWGQRACHFADPDGNLWEVFTWVKKD